MQESNSKEQLLAEIERLKSLQLKLEAAERVIQHQDQLIRSIHESSQDWIWFADKDGLITQSNWAVKGLLGYEVDEILGKPYSHLIYSENEPEVRKEAEMLISSRKDWKDRMFRWKHKDGSTPLLECRANAITNEDETFIGFSGMNHYTSERVRIKEDQNGSEEKYRSLFTSANDAIFLMQDYVFISCNPKTLEMFDCEEHEIVGHSPMEFSPESQSKNGLSSEMAMAKMKAALDGKPQFFEWVHQKKNGVLFNAEVSLNKMVFANGEYIQAIVRDITERKEAENKIQIYQLHLEELVRERTRELETKNDDLERYNRLFEGREFRIKELRDKVKELEKQLSYRL